MIGSCWSRTEDDRLWVIGTFSDTRPFVEYLFDRPRKGHPLPDSKGDRRSGHGRGIEPPSRAFAAVSSRFDIAEKPNFSLPAFFGKIDEDFHLGRIKSDKNTAFLLHGWSPIGGSAPASPTQPSPGA
jgi:hypothetical protein